MPATPQGKQTQTHARALRVHIEALDDLHRVRNQLVHRAQALVDADDIRDRILRVASGFERLVEVEPAMFEDVLDEELAKYDKFLKEMGEMEQRQNGTLSEIRVRSGTSLSWQFLDPKTYSVETSFSCSPEGMILPSKNGNMLYSPLI